MKAKDLIERLSKLDPKLDVLLYVDNRLIGIDDITTETYREAFVEGTEKCVMLSGDIDMGLPFGDGFEWVGDEE